MQSFQNFNGHRLLDMTSKPFMTKKKKKKELDFIKKTRLGLADKMVFQPEIGD